jgi:DNA repair ATPase RecN
VIGLVLSLYQVTYVKPVINQKYVSEDPELVGEVMTLVKNMSETNAKYNEKKINELKEKSREVNKTLNEIVISDSEREELKKKIESMEERRKEFEDKMDLNSDSSE